MASEASAPVAITAQDQTLVPFAPSWVDWVVGQIRRLPIPSWVTYPGLVGILFLLLNFARWLQGSAPTGTFDAPNAFVVIYPVYNLAAIHYLDREAALAFDFFRPALGKTDAEAARLKYELTTLPARAARIVAIIGLGLFAAMFLGLSEREGLPFGIEFWTICIIAAAGFVITAELVYHTLRQLRLVSHIHARAECLDLFHFTPLYSFSALTARTGLVFAVVLWYDLAINPETLVNAPLAALNGALLLLCAVCFILPLQGMHHRIVVEKRRLEWDVNQRVRAVVDHLYGKVDGLDLHDADAVNKTISSLVATRELISKMPTWPWRPETFAAFFSALALPVIVFLIQMSLKTLIGFK